MEVGFVVCARSDLAVVRRTRRYVDVLAGILEDGTGGVSGVRVFKGDLKADVEEVLFERDDMVVVGCACDFRSIVARLRKEAGDFDDGSHGDDASVGGEGARCLLGGSLVVASVRYSEGLLVGALGGRSLRRERRRDVGRFFVG